MKNNAEIFNKIVNVLKHSSSKKVDTYLKTDIFDNLRNDLILSNQGFDYFLEQEIYYYNETEKIIYIEHGVDKHAEQLLLNFNKNIYHYDDYYLPYDCFTEDPREVDPDLLIENWNKEYGNSDKMTYGDLFAGYPVQAERTDEEYKIIEEDYKHFWSWWENTYHNSENGSLLEILNYARGYGYVVDEIIEAISSDFKDDLDEITEDFIYRINDSAKLKTTLKDSDIEYFFTTIEEDSLDIISVDTKEKLITIEKSVKNNKNEYKFIVDIINDDGESFSIKSFIKSKEQLETLIRSTIDSLRNFEQFSKYLDDLENCL